MDVNATACKEAHLFGDNHIKVYQKRQPCEVFGGSLPPTRVRHGALSHSGE
jgi:hypothetical protein